MKLYIYGILNDIDTFLKANLNTAITANNTEYGDSLLSTLANDAYVLHSLNEVVTNRDPFVFYALNTVSSEGIGPASNLEMSFSIILMKSDDGNDADIAQKSYRYADVLKGLFEDNYDRINRQLKFELMDIGIKEATLNTNDNYRVIGIQVRATYA